MKILQAIILLTFISSATAYAKDGTESVKGKKLHATKCIACHTAEVYTRSDRTIKSLDSLEIRVNACIKNAVKEEWTTEETSSVVNYLNKEFYKF